MRQQNDIDEIVAHADASLLDLLDHVLDQGVVLDGELVLGLADVDLVYVRLGALISAAENVLSDAERP